MPTFHILNVMSDCNKTKHPFWFFTFLSIFITSCSRTSTHVENSSGQTPEDTLTDFTTLENLKWVADTNFFWGYIKFEQNLTDGNLAGNHQFIRRDGNRIDFCEEHSIDLVFIKDSLWKGQMIDCYDELTHELSMRLISDKSVFFQIEGNMHEFLPDTFSLYLPDNTAY